MGHVTWHTAHTAQRARPALRAPPRWQLQQQMGKSFETQKSMGLQQEGESDELKRVFLEGNPYLLVSKGRGAGLGGFKNGCGFKNRRVCLEGNLLVSHVMPTHARMRGLPFACPQGLSHNGVAARCVIIIITFLWSCPWQMPAGPDHGGVAAAHRV